MDRERRTIPHPYNLRSLNGSALQSRAGHLINVDASNSTSHLQTPHQESRNTSQPQRRRGRPRRESRVIDTSLGDGGRIICPYYLRSLTESRRVPGTQDQRDHTDASSSKGHPLSHQDARSTSQQQRRRGRPLKEESCGVSRSLRDRGTSRSRHSKDKHQEGRRINSTIRAHLPGIPTSTSDKPDDTPDEIKCIICLDTIDDSEMKYIECGHSFHKNCCDNWLKVNNVCPICRAVVAPGRICEVAFNDTSIRNRILFRVRIIYGDLTVLL